MKNLFVAYVEVTVYGTSWISAQDAMENAKKWWAENGDEPAPDNKIKTIEFCVPDTADDDDFRSDAQIGDYKKTAEGLTEREKWN